MDHPTPNSETASLRLLCVALMGGVATFLAVAWFVTPPEGLVPGLGPEVTQVLATVSVLLLVGASLFESRRRLAAKALPEPRPADYERTTTIVGFALRELAGLQGVLVGLLSGQMVLGTVLAGVALLVMLIGLPKGEG